jgi:hypothetical protein
MAIVPWAIAADKVSLQLGWTKVLKTYFAENNGEWILDDTGQYRIPGYVDTVGFVFKIKRRSAFLVVNVFLPVVFMSFVNILVFFLPVQSGEKVSFSITVLLSLAVFLTVLVNNLPKTSQPMAFLCYYIMFMLVASVLMCVATILNVRLFYKKGPVPAWCKKMAGVIWGSRPKLVSGKEELQDENENDPGQEVEAKNFSWSDISRMSDLFCAVFFVFSFIVFNSFSAYMILSKIS